MVRHSISRRDLVAIGLTAVLLRCLLIAALMLVEGRSIAQIANARDGGAYLEYAAAIDANDFTQISGFNRRVFPGYPLMIWLIATAGIPPELSALLLSVSGAAGGAVLSAIIFRDSRVGWAMAILTPSHLLYTSLAMSEGVLIFVAVLSVWLALNGRLVASGAALGIAALVRPLVVSVAAGLVCMILRRARSVVVLGASSVGVALTGLAAMHLWTGEVMPGIAVYLGDDRAYGGGLFSWPFQSLITTPAIIRAPAWKVAYVWMHVLVVSGCCIAAVRNAHGRDAADLDRLAAGWLIANTAIVVCIGGFWGFAEFHRFVIPALPPLFYVARRWIPTGWGLVPVAGASAWMAFIGEAGW